MDGLPEFAQPQLLAGIREQLLTLPGDTAVYPGHGPRTTVATEAPRDAFGRCHAQLGHEAPHRGQFLFRLLPLQLQLRQLPVDAGQVRRSPAALLDSHLRLYLRYARFGRLQRILPLGAVDLRDHRARRDNLPLFHMQLRKHTGPLRPHTRKRRRLHLAVSHQRIHQRPRFRHGIAHFWRRILNLHRPPYPAADQNNRQYPENTLHAV